MPHLGFLINFAVTDMILLSKHSMLVLKLYSVYHVYGYIQGRSTKVLTTTGMLDITIYTCFIALVSLIQYWICRLSQNLRARGIKGRAT
jgi:hypothetical protein